MERITVKLPSFQSVGAGSTATCSIPIGGTYHQVLIAFAGFAISSMKEIRLGGNGRVMMRYVTTPIMEGGELSGGERLNTRNKYEGRGASSNNLLVLDFERYGIRTKLNQELTGIGTGFKPSHPEYRKAGGLGVELSELTLEIDLKSTISGTPVLSARAIKSDPRPLGLFKKVITYFHSAPAAGPYEISSIIPGELINKVYAISDKISGLKVEVEQNLKFDRLKAENNLIQSDGVRTPQTALVVFDPSETGNGSDALPTKGVQDLRITYEMSEAAPIPIVVEYIGVLSL